MNPVETALADAHRREWARVLAATARVARDLDLAEECVQEAYAAALRSWAATGVPDNPAAWLTTTAKRRAVDVIRHDSALRARLPLLVEPEGEPEPTPPADDAARVWERTEDAMNPALPAPDDRLRLIFTCCHPALAADAQVALTLRLVCGVATPDIARSSAPFSLTASQRRCHEISVDVAARSAATSTPTSIGHITGGS